MSGLLVVGLLVDTMPVRTMLKINHFDGVTRFDLARTFAGRGRYWTTAYLVDGMMVDTGCAHSAPELMQALSEETLVRM